MCLWRSNESLIKRLVDMVEKLTKRVIEIEDNRRIETVYKYT